MLTMQSFWRRCGNGGRDAGDARSPTKQVELLRTLATASSDVQDRRSGTALEIDETFFGILRAQIEATSQMNDNNLVNDLLNLQAKLADPNRSGPAAGKATNRLHALSRDAKREGGLNWLLAQHVIANEHDDALATPSP